MILFALLGALLEHLTTVQHALLPALLLGMIVANFVPNTASCRVKLPPPRPKPTAEPPVKEPDARS